MIFSYLAKPEKPSWPGPPFQMFRFIESPQLEVFEGISTTFPHRCWLDCSNDCNCWCCCTYTHYVLHTWHSKSLIIGMTKVQKKFAIMEKKSQSSIIGIAARWERWSRWAIELHLWDNNNQNLKKIEKNFYLISWTFRQK